MVIFRNFCSKNCQFSMNFHNNSRDRNRKSRKIVFFIRFSTLRIFYVKMATSMGDGAGGVCISLVGKQPDAYYLFEVKNKYIQYNIMLFHL